MPQKARHAWGIQGGGGTGWERLELATAERLRMRGGAAAATRGAISIRTLRGCDFNVHDVVRALGIDGTAQRWPSVFRDEAFEKVVRCGSGAKI